MAEVMDRTAQTQHGIAVRRFTSPNRILARSFRLSRDKWKLKHHQVQAKLKQAKQLACERGTARDRWREQCEQATARIVAAEATAAQALSCTAPAPRSRTKKPACTAPAQSLRSRTKKLPRS